MAIELQCPGCNGRLMVETPGLVVACPHCGMHLQAPAAPGVEASDPVVAPPTPPLDVPPAPNPPMDDVTINIEPAEIEWPTIEESPAEPWLHPDEGEADENVPDFLATLGDVDAGDISDGATMQLTEPVAEHPVPEAVSGADATMMELPAPFPPITGASPAADLGSIEETIGDAGVPATAAAFDKTETLPSMPEQFTEPFTPRELAADEKTEAFTAPVVPVAPSPTIPDQFEVDKSRLDRLESRLSPPLNKLILNYAIAMTLMCAYLAYQVLNSSPGPNPLDLPDLAPPRDVKGKKTTLRFVAPETVMPRAYSLTLGESQQYGSLRVTPVRVTRGPLEFVHYDPASKTTRDSVGPVLKLHLKIENVSEDQEFPPLDRELVFRREPDDKRPELLLSNNWVCRESEKKRSGKRVLVYDLPIGSPWNLKDQSLDRDLKPGETLETYIPTTAESIESLSGPLIWRIHFRKGYNPQSFRGVTTVVEVMFDSAQIENETQAL